MAILKPVIVPAKVLKDGKHKVRIALSHNSDVRYIVTNILIDDASQLKAGQIVKRPDASYLNVKLRGLLNKYQQSLDEIEYLDGLSCSEVIFLLKNGVKKHTMTLQGVFDEYLRYSTAKESTKRRYVTDFSSLSKSMDKNMPIASIRHTTILETDRRLRDRNLKSGTRCIIMSFLSALIKHAIRCGYLDANLDPFKGYHFPEKETRQSWLTVDEVKAIRDYDAPTEGQALTRDLFMLSYYLGGINLVDLVKVDFKKNGRKLKYIRTKTELLSKQNKYVEFEIPDEAVEILKRRMGNDGRLALTDAQRKCNCQNLMRLHMPKLAAALNIPNLVFYSARKSFSQHAFNLGVNTAVIDFILGHKIGKGGASLYSYIYVTPKMATDAIKLVLKNLK